MIKKILSFLGIEAFGWYELLFAMYLILVGYRVGSIPMSALMMIILAIIALIRGAKPVFEPQIIIVVFAYFIIHDLIIWAIMPIHPSYMLSNIVVNTVSVLSLYIIVSALDYRKTMSMLYLVAIATLIGLYYHVALIRAGKMVEPIRLPFMPAMSESSRAFEEGFRPKSFFWEPAACVTFLMVPFFISIIQKRWFWVFVLMFSLFISTSTNGIVLSVIILGVYFIIGEGKLQYKFFAAIVMVGMLYLFFNTNIFEFGRDKLYDTQMENNARLSNGPILLSRTDPQYLIFGVPSANAFEYVKENSISTNGLVMDAESMFVPSFWNILLLYGITGLFLYLSIYWKLVKKDKRLIPYVVGLFVAMFVQSISLGSTFFFQIICMLLLIRNKTVI